MKPGNEFLIENNIIIQLTTKPGDFLIQWDDLPVEHQKDILFEFP